MKNPSCKKLVTFISILNCIMFLLVLLNNHAIANDESWKDEFNTLCGNTEKAMTMSEDELNIFIERCDKLLPVIEAADEPRKKAYLFRLGKCRKFFQYMIDSKEDGRTE